MTLVRELILWQIVIAILQMQICCIEKIDANVTNKAVAVTRTTTKWTSIKFLTKQNAPTYNSTARTTTRTLAAVNSLCLNDTENTWSRSRIIDYLINNNTLSNGDKETQYQSFEEIRVVGQQMTNLESDAFRNLILEGNQLSSLDSSLFDNPHAQDHDQMPINL